MLPDDESRATRARLSHALAIGDQATVDAITKQLDDEDAAKLRRLSRPGALLDSAIWYAQAGIPVFPLEVGVGWHDPETKKEPKGKRPLFRKAHRDGEPECHGECGRDGHGFYDATTDVDKVRAWWRATPQANIGLPTGLLFDVIDVDLPAGYFSLGEMRADDVLPTIHGRVITASGGTHLYIRPDGDGNATGILPGIDWRGRGGYVVAPPSRCEEGMWLWTSPLDLDALRQEATA